MQPVVGMKNPTQGAPQPDLSPLRQASDQINNGNVQPGSPIPGRNQTRLWHFETIIGEACQYPAVETGYYKLREHPGYTIDPDRGTDMSRYFEIINTTDYIENGPEPSGAD